MGSTAEQVTYEITAPSTPPATPSVSKRAQRRQQAQADVQYEIAAPSAAGTTPSTLSADDRTGETASTTGFESYTAPPLTQGIISPEAGAKLASVGQVGKYRDQVNQAYRDIAAIAAKPVTPQYTAEQRSRDLDAQTEKVRNFARMIGQSETMGRIISGTSSPAGLGTFLLAFVNRPLAAIAGGGMSVSQLGSKKPEESNADYMERVLLGLAGLTGSAALVAPKGPISALPSKIRGAPEAARAQLQKTLGAGPRIAGEVGEKLQKETVATAEANRVRTEEAAAKHTEQVAAHETATKTAARIKEIDKIQDTQARDLVDNVKTTYEHVKKSMDERWADNRKDVGKDRPVGGLKPIYDAIQDARTKLAHLPDSLKILDQIEKLITEKKEMGGDISDPESVQPTLKESIPYEELRRMFTVAGDYAFSATDRTARAGLFKVRDAVDMPLTQANILSDAEKGIPAAEQGAKYAALKKDYHQMMQDWVDQSSMTTGGTRGDPLSATPGSPLSRIVRMGKDAPKPVLSLVTGPFGERLVNTLDRYKSFGADANLVAEIRKLSNEAATTAKPTAKALAEPAPPAPDLKPAPLPEDISVERQAIIRNQLAYLQRFRPWDWIAVAASPVLWIFGQHMVGAATLLGLGVEKGVLAAMDKPRFVAWLAKPTAKDLIAISHLPEEIQTPLKQQINKFVADERAAGGTVGTATGAARDTALFQQAKKELGPSASISAVARRAQELKTKPTAIKVDPLLARWLALGVAAGAGPAAGAKTEKAEETPVPVGIGP